ncbi:MAG TPA: alpha/beta hydrolase-fold protein [Opitutaceae bacterium]|nr:alpha/beta hydrolase-fold protein [Opitutaceae bacterium]
MPSKPRITGATPALVSRSRETGTSYPVYVDAPDDAAEPGPWPAVLLMDGDFLFDPAVRALRSLRAAGEATPAVIVGVGYGAGFGEPGNHRGRDYTPTAAPEEPSSGGADRFLDYLSGTLWPELARRYPLRESDRGIAGHSVGSLFVLYALFQARPFFNLALASAPSIWWDNRSILRLAAALRDRQSELGGRLYLAAGEDDTPSMIGDLGLLEKQLQDRPFEGLGVVSQRFAGRNHYDVVPHTLRSGLLALLGRDSSRPTRGDATVCA